MMKNAFFWLVGLLVSALMVCGFVVIAPLRGGAISIP
jgi:hypothetical protein